MILFVIVWFIVFLLFVINDVECVIFCFLLVCCKVIFILCLNVLLMICIKVILLWCLGFMLVWILKINFENELLNGFILIFFFVCFVFGIGVKLIYVFKKFCILKLVKVELKNIGVKFLFNSVLLLKVLFVFLININFLIVCLKVLLFVIVWFFFNLKLLFKCNIFFLFLNGLIVLDFLLMMLKKFCFILIG